MTREEIENLIAATLKKEAIGQKWNRRGIIEDLRVEITDEWSYTGGDYDYGFGYTTLKIEVLVKYKSKNGKERKAWEDYTI